MPPLAEKLFLAVVTSTRPHARTMKVTRVELGSQEYLPGTEGQGYLLAIHPT
jgi:hypothetical protein